MRTYFRDKQIHISGDAVYAAWQYYLCTGDFSIFPGGAAEIFVECARFFHSYACHKMARGRYELHDVTGPDEYHERVNNNAFTNRLAKFVFDRTFEMLDLLERNNPGAYAALEVKVGFASELDGWRSLTAGIFLQLAEPRARIPLLLSDPLFFTSTRCRRVSNKDCLGL